MSTRGVLAECLRIFEKDYPGVDVRSESMISRIEKDIAHDLLAMQVQPCLMDEFRRFVLVRPSRSAPMDDKDGVCYSPCRCWIVTNPPIRSN